MQAVAYRFGTQDSMAIKEVIFDNQYRLPERFSEDDVILDIGAHIGTFALACKQRGNPQLWCIEPDPSNFEYLKKNIGGQATLWPVALWRSDTNCDQVEFKRMKDSNGTCMGTVGGDGPHNRGLDIPFKVGAIGLDKLIQTAVGEGEVRLCKMDIESAEWPALWTSKRLHQIQELIVELHFPVGDKILEVAKEFGAPTGPGTNVNHWLEFTSKYLIRKGFDPHMQIQPIWINPHNQENGNWMVWAYQKKLI